MFDAYLAQRQRNPSVGAPFRPILHHTIVTESPLNTRQGTQSRWGRPPMGENPMPVTMGENPHASHDGENPIPPGSYRGCSAESTLVRPVGPCPWALRNDAFLGSTARDRASIPKLAIILNPSKLNDFFLLLTRRGNSFA